MNKRIRKKHEAQKLQKNALFKGRKAKAFLLSYERFCQEVRKNSKDGIFIPSELLFLTLMMEKSGKLDSLCLDNYVQRHVEEKACNKFSIVA